MKMMNIDESVVQMQIYMINFGYDQQSYKKLLFRVPLIIEASATWGYLDQFIVLLN